MCDRISEAAEIGEGFAHGIGIVVEDDVRIGANVTLGNHVTVCCGTRIGDGVTVADFAVLGRKPKLAKSSTAAATVDMPGLVVGDECSIGSHTVVMSGTTLGARAIVGDNAGIRERCRIGDDAVVGRSVTVENDTTIGDRVKIQSGAYVTAYVVIEDDVFIAPMVVTTNDNYMGRTQERFKHMRGATIRRGARVGGGVHILPGIEIGEEAFIATGAVVTRDVPARTLVMGVPAKPVRPVPAEELLENQ
jgi:acetyltransferase-like isoleucine patch superfamily enzyme